MVVLSRTGSDVGRAGAVRGALTAVLVGAGRDLARLVVPVECAGCGRLDVPLCPDCRARLGGPVRRCEDAAPRLDRVGRAPLPVWTLAAYTGPTRELVVAWKDRGRTDLTPTLAAALADGARDVAAVLVAAGLTGPTATVAAPVVEPPARPDPRALPGTAGPAPTCATGPVLVVPAPSSAAARRRRGVDLVGMLAGAVARGLTDGGVPAVAAPVLAQRHGARDQVGLSARARRANVRGRVRWRARCTPPARRTPVVLVDDVLTTGATLAACDEAVRAVGACVVAALTLAATPPPGGRRDLSRGG